MSEEAKPATFDLVSALHGRGYPEDAVDVYLNEDIGYAIHKLNERLSTLATKRDTEGYAEVEAQLDEILASVSDYKYTFHLRGIPRKAKRDILTAVETKFPDAGKTDFLGRPEKVNYEAEELLSSMLWAAHITKIVAPGGAEVVAPSVEVVQEFRDHAPDSAIRTLALAIDGDGAQHKGLAGGATEGFEIAIRGADFLSQPSPKGEADSISPQ